MDPVLNDERITSVGLLMEAHGAVIGALDRAMAARGEKAPPNVEILLRLARSDRQQLRMTDLAAQSGMSPSGLSRAVDRLVAEGLVARVACPEDARGAFAQLTTKGNKRVVAFLRTHVHDVQHNFIDVFSTEELARFEALCRKLRDTLNPCATAGAD